VNFYRRFAGERILQARFERTPGDRTLRAPEPKFYPVTTSDGTEVRLTRYHAGNKGPVILAPGYGNSARVFALTTNPTSFLEYLAANGYDVWLFDFRSSPDLEASRTQFTVDDIALRDYPAALAKVRQESGADSVQVLAHCVGSMSFVMALAAGLKGVRSGVCSQLGAHPIPTPLNRLRCWIRLATLMKGIGVDRMTTDYTPRLVDASLDALMRVFGGKHRNEGRVARRISFIYGDVYDNSRINAPTLEAMEGVFGMSNMTFFEHIAKMIRRGHVIDATGGERYLADLGGLTMPITFLHGEHNRMFLPQSTRETYELLCKVNGSQHYRRHVIPGYAHLDCWVGERAEADVFPLALSELERFN
jgi:pimeloyl-ACP methyl ester carboxylesterase